MRFHRRVVGTLLLVVGLIAIPLKGHEYAFRDLIKDDPAAPESFVNGQASEVLKLLAEDDGEGLSRLLKADPKACDFRDKQKRNFWHYAAAHRASKCAQVATQIPRLLSKIDEGDEKGKTPLRYSTALEDVALMRILLAHKADEHGEDNMNESPWSFSINSGLSKSLQVFVEARPRKNRLSKYGGNVLITQIRRGHEEVACMLVDAGCGADPGDVPLAPLELAISRQMTKLVAALLKAGAKVDRSTSSGSTMLALAASLPSTEIVNQLLVAGAKGVPAKEGSLSALSIAVAASRIDNIKALIAAGEPISASKGALFSPLEVALFVGDRQSIDLLVNAGATVDPKREMIHDLVERAVQVDAIAVVRNLGENGFDFSQPLNGGWSAYTLAKACNSKNVVSYLEQKGATSEVGHRFVKKSELDSPPKPTKVAPPEDPRPSQENAPEANVRLTVIIDPEGRVKHPLVDRSDDTRLSLAAIEAVRKWEFARLSAQGQPVAIRASLIVNFKSRDDQGFKGSELDTQPAYIKVVNPIYPYELKVRRIQGRVSIRFVIEKDGSVLDAWAEATTDEAFVMPALAAVRQWKFKPGMIDGRPVKVLAAQDIIFNLD
ncbi:MAG: TonB family protein [Opitutaceae bacterium]|nr:TonB family protein [Opitutaceae bacterium]